MFRILFLLCIIVVTESHAASFDCARATTNVEKLICANERLSSLDNTLNEQYENAKIFHKNISQLVAQQKAWLLSRNKCKQMACLKRSYEVRIQEIACAENMGSAAGASTCYYFRLLESEMDLEPLENQYARQLEKTSSDPKHVQELLAKENTKWREYRDATCALIGELEGGSDSWKNVWVTACEVDETKKRITALTLQVEEK